MKIVTYNLNGIRAAIKKDLMIFLNQVQADVICFQEIKADIGQIPTELFESMGYTCYWYPAVKKGYSGVGIASKIPVFGVKYGCNHPLFDNEGRVISITLANCTIMSAYFPSGTTGDMRQQIKYEFLTYFYDYVAEFRKENHPLIIAGDYNICHKAIDIHNPISNKNSSGFLPEERAWMDKWFDADFQDSFRLINPTPHNYTWWSYRAGARKNNKGWRIDYISVDKKLRITNAGLFANDMQSDHCASFCEVSL